MDGGVIVDGKLFITLQRLDSFAVTQNAYVAIFDTATDTEIDANIAGDSLKGIPLQTRNPTTILYEPISDVIFIQGSGSFFPVEYTGGIERINLTDLTTTVILDDGDAVTHPYGLITKLAAISDDILYFVGYESFTDNTLYRLDLATAEITASGIASLTSGQISDLAVDVLGLLWVGDAANATVRVIDTVTDTEVDALSTNLNPEKIVFVN
jgi:DNA-binding beta-propeller fold protein YncE